MTYFLHFKLFYKHQTNFYHLVYVIKVLKWKKIIFNLGNSMILLGYSVTSFFKTYIFVYSLFVYHTNNHFKFVVNHIIVTIKNLFLSSARTKIKSKNYKFSENAWSYYWEVCLVQWSRCQIQMSKMSNCLVSRKLVFLLFYSTQYTGGCTQKEKIILYLKYQL